MNTKAYSEQEKEQVRKVVQQFDIQEKEKQAFLKWKKEQGL